MDFIKATKRLPTHMENVFIKYYRSKDQFLRTSGYYDYSRKRFFIQNGSPQGVDPSAVEWLDETSKKVLAKKGKSAKP